jgi:hypothetical protein
MASDNPYQSPKTQSPPAPKKRATGKLVFGILLLIGVVPASAIAFFCCCLAAATATERGGGNGDAAISTGMAVGGIGGLLTFGLMLWGGIVMIRRSKQPPRAAPL